MAKAELAKVEVSNQDVISAMNTLQNISSFVDIVKGNMVQSTRTFDPVAKGLIAKNMRFLTGHSNDYENVRAPLEEENRKMDANGFVINDVLDADGKVVRRERVWKKGGELAFSKAYKELVSAVFEAEFYMIPMSLLEVSDITPEELATFIWMIDTEA